MIKTFIILSKSLLKHMKKNNLYFKEGKCCYKNCVTNTLIISKQINSKILLYHFNNYLNLYL